MGPNKICQRYIFLDLTLSQCLWCLSAHCCFYINLLDCIICPGFSVDDVPACGAIFSLGANSSIMLPCLLLLSSGESEVGTAFVKPFTHLLEESAIATSSFLYQTCMTVSKMMAQLRDKTMSVLYCDTGGLIIEAVNCSIFGRSYYSFERGLQYPIHHADNPHCILCFMWCRGVTRGVKVLS